MDLVQRADQGGWTRENDGGGDTNSAGRKGAWRDKGRVDRAIRIYRGGLVGLPFRLLRSPTHTGGGTIADGITRRIGHERGLAGILIDRLGTGRIRRGGQGNATADRANDGTHRGEGAEGGGLEDGGLVIRSVERLVLLGFHKITGIHLLGQKGAMRADSVFE